MGNVNGKNVAIIGPGGRALLAALSTRIGIGVNLSVIDADGHEEEIKAMTTFRDAFEKDEKFELTKNFNNKCTGRKSDRKRNRKDRWL